MSTLFTDGAEAQVEYWDWNFFKKNEKFRNYIIEGYRKLDFKNKKELMIHNFNIFSLLSTDALCVIFSYFGLLELVKYKKISKEICGVVGQCEMYFRKRMDEEKEKFIENLDKYLDCSMELVESYPYNLCIMLNGDYKVFDQKWVEKHPYENYGDKWVSELCPDEMQLYLNGLSGSGNDHIILEFLKRHQIPYVIKPVLSINLFDLGIWTLVLSNLRRVCCFGIQIDEMDRFNTYLNNRENLGEWAVIKGDFREEIFCKNAKYIQPPHIGGQYPYEYPLIKCIGVKELLRKNIEFAEYNLEFGDKPRKKGKIYLMIVIMESYKYFKK